MEVFRDSISDVNGRHWNCLGVTIYNEEVNQLEVQLQPHRFRHFCLNSPYPLLHAIFSGNKRYPAVNHVNPDNETGDFDPNSTQYLVALNFSYRYVEEDPTGEIITIVPRHPNRAGLGGLHLENQLPVYAAVAIHPYIPAYQNHDQGVETYLYYRWTHYTPEPEPGAEPTLLRIRIDQEPIPMVPEDAPPPESVPWQALGSFRLTVVQEEDPLIRELWFWESYHEFLFSFPTSLRAKLFQGIGVRATNVYTPGGLLHGFQVKLKERKDSCEVAQDTVKKEQYIAIAIGSDLLWFNPNFKKNVVRVHYRWRKTALELRIQLDGDDQSDDQLLGKRKLESFLAGEEKIEDNFLVT